MKTQKEIKEGKCIMCNKQGVSLLDISKLDIKVFGRIPINEIVKEWYKKGYVKEDIVCEECIIK